MSWSSSWVVYVVNSVSKPGDSDIRESATQGHFRGGLVGAGSHTQMPIKLTLM